MRAPRALLALSLLPLCSGACSNRLFLHPTHDELPVAGDVERITVEAQRRPIRGREFEVFRAYRGPDLPLAVTVLAFGGNGGRAEFTGAALHGWMLDHPEGLPCNCPEQRCGVEILAVQYPGFGADDEPATLRGLGAGALDAWDWARERSDAPIVVYGLSMGTTAALHIARSQAEAGEPGPAALILDRPPAIPQLVLGRFGWWNLWLVAGPVAMSLPRSVYSRANARHIEDTPALFILGADDELATPRNAGRVEQAYAGPKLTAWFDGHHNARVTPREPAVAAGWSWLLASIDRDLELRGQGCPMPGAGEGGGWAGLAIGLGEAAVADLIED